jgi:hypothetical protein
MLKHQARDFQCSSTKQETSNAQAQLQDYLKMFQEISKCLWAFEFDRV